MKLTKYVFHRINCIAIISKPRNTTPQMISADVGSMRLVNRQTLQNEIFLPNIIRVIKSGKLRWVEHVVRIDVIKMHVTFPSEDLKTKEST